MFRKVWLAPDKSLQICTGLNMSLQYAKVKKRITCSPYPQVRSLELENRQTWENLSDSCDSESPNWITSSGCRICVTQSLKEADRKYFSGRGMSLPWCSAMDLKTSQGTFQYNFSVFSVLQPEYKGLTLHKKKKSILPLKTQRPVC